jgi:hypothetical protein
MKYLLRLDILQEYGIPNAKDSFESLKRLFYSKRATFPIFQKRTLMSIGLILEPICYHFARALIREVLCGAAAWLAHIASGNDFS